MKVRFDTSKKPLEGRRFNFLRGDERDLRSLMYGGSK